MAGTRGARHRLRCRAAEGPEPRLCHARPEDHGAPRESGPCHAVRCRPPQAQPRCLCAGLSSWARGSMRRAASAMPISRSNSLTTGRGAAPSIAAGARTPQPPAPGDRNARRRCRPARRPKPRSAGNAVPGHRRRRARAGIPALWGWPPRGSRSASTCRASCSAIRRARFGQRLRPLDRRRRYRPAVRAALEAGIIVKGGGHAMAAGLTVERARLGDFRAFLETALRLCR